MQLVNGLLEMTETEMHDILIDVANNRFEGFLLWLRRSRLG